MVRGINLLVKMAYIKFFDKTVVDMFRDVVAKYPNRVMFVNASDETEWTYSKVLIRPF